MKEKMKEVYYYNDLRIETMKKYNVPNELLRFQNL